MFKNNLSLLLFFFLFVQITVAQKTLQVADSIFFNHNQYSKKESLEKSIAIYNIFLKKIKDTSSEKYIKILAKKYLVKSLLEVAEIRNDSAYPNIKKSLSLQQNIGFKDHYLKGHSYRQLYKYWEFKGNQDSIIKNTQIAEIAFRDTLGLQHKLISEAMYVRGSAFGRKGQKREEIELCKKAIANNIVYQGEFNEDVAVQEHVLATVYGNIGYYKKELESYKKVIKYWEAMPNHKDMSYLNIAYNSISMCYLLYGDTKTAEQYLLKSERLVKEHKQDILNWSNETFKGRTKLGGLYYRGKLAAYKKDTITALNYANQILDFVDNFDKTKKENNSHNLSYFYEFVKNYQMATLRFKADLIRAKTPEESKKLSYKVLDIVKENSISRFTLKDRLHIITYYINNDSIAKANSLIDKNIKGGKLINDNYSLIHLYDKKADLLLKQKKFKELNNVYKNLLKRTQRDTAQIIDIEVLNYNNINPYGSQSILDILIKISANYTKLYQNSADKKDLKKAYNIIKLASEVFSKNFGHLVYNDSKYLTTTHINEQLLSIALLDDTISKNEILEIIEENGSKTIWNKFLDSQQRKFLNIPDSILQKENELLAELYYYKKQLYLNKETDLEKVNSYKELLLSITNEIEETEKWYQNTYPTYYNQKVKRLKIQELKDKLKDNQKVIKYIFTDENVYAFTITKNKTNLFFIDNKQKLTNSVKPLVALLKEPNRKGYKEKAQEIYALLISKVSIAKEKNEELIFIQDDILNYIPMEALVDENEKYLISSHKVSYTPSLLLLNGQINAKKSKKNKLGIYAPNYKKYEQENPKRDQNTTLLGASMEASKIANMFNTSSFSGVKANKEQFLSDAKNYNMLHLAMHSSFNNVDPEFSSLIFSSAKKDNKLFVSELYNISLNADLVVLSACNTGSGSLKKGEGFVNVSRAFTYAGVPSLVASLWSVPDLETSKIMVGFYEELKKGKSKNEALQIAKVNYLKNAEYNTLKHPFYWAGFIVSGDVSPVQSSEEYWWLGIILSILLLIVFRKKLIKLF